MLNYTKTSYFDCFGRKWPFSLRFTRNCLQTQCVGRSEAETCALLRYYAASNGNPLPTFRDNVLVRSSTVKEVLFSSSTSWPLNMRPIRCSETSVKNYHSSLRNIPEERRYHQHRGGSLKSQTWGSSNVKQLVRLRTRLWFEGILFFVVKGPAAEATDAPQP